MWSVFSSIRNFCNYYGYGYPDSNTSHLSKGTSYDQEAIAKYAASNHGYDGQLFLDPYFRPDLENLKNVRVLDAGCGAAPWAIYAANEGGEVYAIDIQEGMIQAARKAIEVVQLQNRITLARGDVANLPYESDFFDKMISICVACNLPKHSFEKHFSESKRTLKNGGIGVFGAPSSLNVVFTDGKKNAGKVAHHIQEVLDQLPDDPTSEQIVKQLNELKEVLSATFYLKNHRLTLVQNEKDLKEGDPIWRKLPKLVVPNYFYSRGAYIAMFQKHNFVIKREDLPHFNSESERINYNNQAQIDAQLGPEYVSHPPFIIFHVKKSDESSIWEITSVVKKIAGKISEMGYFFTRSNTEI